MFFDTGEALLSQDTNGRIDVYEWAPDTLRLISSGRSGHDSAFLDASADGQDVFFTTREQLVGADDDALIDVYDARVGGGLPEQENQPECMGDACQGPVSPPPALSGAGTGTLGGSGNVRTIRRAAPKRCKRGRARKRVRGKVRCVKKRHRRVKHR